MEIENKADTVDKGVLKQRTDYTTARLTFDIDLNILIPTREDWEDYPGTVSNSIFTDGSVKDDRTGAEVYSEVLGIRESLRLRNGCNILQAELRVIERAAQLIRCRDETARDITIYTDSQAALRSLSSTAERSRSVVSCCEALSWIRDRKVGLCWIPGHSNVEGNQMAGKLAKLGTTRSGDEAIGLPLPPIKLLRDMIDRTLEEEHGKRWSNRDDCVISRSLWPVLQKRKTTELLGYGKASIRRVVAVITGHCTVGSRLGKMGIRTVDLCAECSEREETNVETLECLEEAAELGVEDLNHFITN
ncbi:uncharacterized protein LOC130895235 [Diorhabda carinulata]|uniref:uncharacterized protein LOC130895235 n=1 Tax=Diorhabda carinulata TaxID=1163345 RepID=UPI0025A25C01|nr:uncharacterized protein LOC130895235 [Diorhabda carinulata]